MNTLKLKLSFLLIPLFIFNTCFAKAVHKPDTVTVGTYITGLYDIDFKDKQYTISLWLWFKYKIMNSVLINIWKYQRQNRMRNHSFRQIH